MLSAKCALLFALLFLFGHSDAQLSGLGKKFGLPSLPSIPKLPTVPVPVRSTSGAPPLLSSVVTPDSVSEEPSKAIAFPDASPTVDAATSNVTQNATLPDKDGDEDLGDDEEGGEDGPLPFEARSGSSLRGISAAVFRSLEEQIKKTQVFVEKGEDGQPLTNKLIEIITVPNLVEVGPPRVVDCKIFGEETTVAKKLGSAEMRRTPPKHVTPNVMSALLEKVR